MTTRDVLLQDLQNSDPAIRSAAVEHPRSARHHVELALKDTDITVRRAAERVALARFRDLLAPKTRF